MIQSTRDALLSELKTNGPADATSLGDLLNLTAMAVRQHLYLLEKEGNVQHVLEKQRMGRPKKKWGLTSKADTHFANSHAALTVELIDAVKRTFGDAGLEKLVKTRAADQEALYLKEMKDARGLEEKLQILVKIRSKEGYMAAYSNGEHEGEYLFIENHCPICVAAKSCTNLCSSELHVFQSVLGGSVLVERQDHILMGARRCVYLCTLKKSAA